ncbi:MAG: DUF302 domain-containing protein [Pseudomonadota bacterium]
MNRFVTVTTIALGAGMLAACADPVAADPVEAAEAERSPVDQARYLVTASAFDHDATLRRLLEALDRRDLTVFATVDHQAGAASVDLTLNPATVVIFGSPQIGTALMQADPVMAAELPLRAAVFEDTGGVTHLAVTSPASIGRSFPKVAEAQAARLDGMARNLQALSAEVTGTEG